MAYYENKHEFLDGALVLFQRNLAVAVPNSKTHRKPAWYMRLKIAGRKGYVTRSTKLTTYEDAYEFAKSELLRLQHASRLGHSFDEFTFEKHWNNWYDRNVANKTWKEDRARWHKMYFNRYFKEYFSNRDGSSMLLNDITSQFATGYWDWRKGFWKSEKGLKLLAYNPKNRNSKTSGTPNAKKAPAVKTLLMEQSALNQIFFDAVERGRMQQVFKMRVGQNNGTSNRRAGFDTGTDLAQLTRNIQSYRDCKGRFVGKGLNDWHRKKRVQLYHFITFLLHSGLRLGEAREMKWSDITFDITVDGSVNPIAEIRISKKTKKGETRLVQAQPDANTTLKKWKSITPYSAADDWVWFGQSLDVSGKPKQFTDLNKSFQTFLDKIPAKNRSGTLLYDKDGDKRSLYSLRHTYATQRLEKGSVSIYDLSLNMGCKVKQIEDHYSHLVTKNRRLEITRFKKAIAAPEAAEQTVGVDEKAFLTDALHLLNSGKLNDEQFLTLVKSVKD